MLVRMNQYNNLAFVLRDTTTRSSDQYDRIITVAIMALASLALILILMRNCFFFKATKAPIEGPRVINVLSQIDKKEPNALHKQSPAIENVNDRNKVADKGENIDHTPIKPKIIPPQNDEGEDRKGIAKENPSEPQIPPPQTDITEDQEIIGDQEPSDVKIPNPPANNRHDSEDVLSDLPELDINDPQSLYQHAMTLQPKEELLVGKKMMNRHEILSMLVYKKSENPHVYYQFGLSLQENGEPSDENKGAQQECFAEAVRLKPNFAEAYCELGILLPNDGTIKLNEEELTKQGLLVKAIDLNQNLAKAYWALGMTLKPDENFPLKDRDMSQQDFFVEAITKNPADGKAYYLLACIPGMQEVMINGKMWSKLELLKEASTAKSPIAKAFYALGLIEKETAKKQVYFLNAIMLQPNLAEAYCELGITLKEGEITDKIKLHDDSELNQQDLYLRAINVNKAYGRAYYLLATLIDKKGHVKVNGLLMSQKDLLGEATKAEEPHAMAYYMLGKQEKDPEKQKQHYLQAISLDPTLAEAYCALGTTLRSLEKIDVGDKKGIDQRELFRIAIQLDGNLGEAYYRLGALLGAQDSVILLDGTVISKKALYLKSIEMTPQFAPTYVGLADMLGIENTEVINGERMDRRALYGIAITHDETYVEAYYKLAENISEDGQQKINGKIWTQLKLCQKIIELEKHTVIKLDNEDLGRVYWMLAQDPILADGKTTIKLSNGEQATRSQLIRKAKELGANKDEFFDCLDEYEEDEQAAQIKPEKGLLSYLNPGNWLS